MKVAEPLAARPTAALVSSRYLTGALAGVIVLATALYALAVWGDRTEAWLHPELYGSSEYIWNFPYQERTWNRLRKALDWKAFDPNVNRVRPLSDLADTVDTIERPYQTWLFGPHPSITPSAILTAVLSPLFLFLFFRAAGFDSLKAAALTALFISCIGFLSVVIDYIRPAKKLTIVSICLALYLGQRHANLGGRRMFWTLLATVFLSFFADELALATYVMVGLLFAPSLLRSAPTWKRLAFLGLPIGFLVTVGWVLPTIYLLFSRHGAWNALADTSKVGVFRFLADPDLYVYTAEHVARAFLTTIGVSTHVPFTEALALLALVVVTVAVGVGWRGSKIAPSTRYSLVASAVALLAAGGYATLLDFYPDPSHVVERSYLGSFTYYYHSPLAIPVILWLGFAWQAASQCVADRAAAARAVLAGGIVACGLMIVGNFTMFHHVNQLVELIHTYPYSSPSMFRVLDEKRAEISAAGRTGTVSVEFTREPEQLERAYEEQLRAVFGERWQDNDFYRTFQDRRVLPIMKDENLKHFVHAYYPWTTFDVRVQ